MKNEATLIITFRDKTYPEKFAKSIEPENKEVQNIINIEQSVLDNKLQLKIQTTELSSFTVAVDDILEKISLIWDLMKNIQNEKD